MKTHEDLRFGDSVDPKEAPEGSILMIANHLFLKGYEWIAALDGGAVEIWRDGNVVSPSDTNYRNSKCYYMGEVHYFEYRDELQGMLDESISRKVKR